MINNISSSSIPHMSSLYSTQATSLTDDQKQTVSDILSNYDVENLTDEEKQNLTTALAESGLMSTGNTIDISA